MAAHATDECLNLPHHTSLGAAVSAWICALPPQARATAQLTCAATQAACDLLQSWQAHPSTQFAATLHNFVYNSQTEWGEMPDLLADIPPQQLAEAQRLCADYAQIVQSTGAEARGHLHARRRMRYFWTAYRDPCVCRLQKSPWPKA